MIKTDTSFVINEAKFVAGSNWTEREFDSSNASDAVSLATKESVNVTKLWQERLTGIDPERFKKEFPIGSNKNQKIDLIDFQQNVAYELKVSGKNPGHEFFKDLFKVLIFNENHTHTKLSTLVFITNGKGIEKLEKGLGKVAADFLLQKFNIKVELARLD